MRTGPLSNLNYYTNKEAISIALIQLWQKSPWIYGYTVKQIVKQIGTFQFVNELSINSEIQKMKSLNEIKESEYVNEYFGHGKAIGYLSPISPSLIKTMVLRVKKVTKSKLKHELEKLIDENF